MKKSYTVKCKVPVVSYVDVYVKATSKAQAKSIAKSFMRDGEDTTGYFDSSGEYGVDPLYNKTTVESVICDEEVI